MILAWGQLASAAILWNDAGSSLICDSGPGRDILEGAVKRDDSSDDTLYFKATVDPLSDSTTEEYSAAFELFEGDNPRVGIGNAAEAWAYTAFFRVDELEGDNPAIRYVDLRSSHLGVVGSGIMPAYELPRRGVQRTIVFKVQFVAGGEDLVTVWLDPDLSSGMTEVLQPENLTTRFSANASFNEIRLRHEGGGDGWVFSDLAIATSFVDFVDPSSAVPRRATATLFDRRRLSFQTWQREPGMPRSAIHAVAQSVEGYLWVAGKDQLARFDGSRFVPVDLGIASEGATITTLFGDSHGGLWIGTGESGLIRHAGGRIGTWTTTAGLPSNTITAITEDRDGTVWIGTASGLICWRAGALQREPGVDRLEGYSIKSLCLDQKGTLWIGAKQAGVFFLRGGTLSELEAGPAEVLLRDPQCLLEDQKGRIWIGAGDDVVLCRSGDEWQRYSIPSHSENPHVQVLAEEPDGTVWAGSASQGLFHFRDGKPVAVNTSTGLDESGVLALLVDREGNLWVGGSAGLHVLRREHCFKLGQAEGLGQGGAGSVVEVAPGVIWVVQPGRGLCRWEGGAFRRVNAARLDPNDPTLGAMLVSRDGSCWIACESGLLLFRDPQAVADESQLFELPDVHITALAEDPGGDIWAGTRQGQLWRLHLGTWINSLRLEPMVPITTLAAQGGGMVWVGTDGDGLYLFDDPVHHRMDIGDEDRHNSIRALHCDSDNTLWVGMAGDGLAALSSGSTTRCIRIDGLVDTTILGILEDQSGHLWLYDASGLTCVAKPAFPANGVEILGAYPIAVSSATEPPAGQTPGAVFPAGCRARSGRLWFPTADGIFVAEPPNYDIQSRAPVLILEDVLVDGVSVPSFQPVGAGFPTAPETPGAAAARLVVGPGRHRFELHFTSPEFAVTRKVRFRYRMEGLDTDWVEAGTARTALYSYLPHGRYRFIVDAYGPDGQTSRASLGLTIHPYPWQRWWVIGLGALGLVAGIAGGVRYVEKRKVRHRLIRLEQEHTLERERSRIAQDLHDEMGAKLCRISFLSEHAGRLESGSSEMKEQIATIADDSRGLLHSLDEIVWAVNPHNDTLEHVASYIGQYAENYFQGTSVLCSLDIPSHLPSLTISSQTRHNLFLAVHEALTNALKHSGAARVEVGISFDGGLLRIRVADNGSGFAETASRREVAGGEASRNGVSNMQQRMESVGGRCRIQSSPGQGTTVEFLVRLNVAAKPEEM